MAKSTVEILQELLSETENSMKPLTTESDLSDIAYNSGLFKAQILVERKIKEISKSTVTTED
jgi:hypothetical protein